MANTKDTLSKNLAAKLLELRQKRGLSQYQLAKLADIPRSTITVMESGSANPSVMTLQKIAEVLGCKIEELLSPSRHYYLHIKNSQIPLHPRSKKGISIRKLLPDSIPHMDFDEVILSPKMTMVGAPHTTGTKEYMICTKGKIQVSLDGQPFDLSEGDVLAFPGSIKHSYKNTAAQEARFLSLVALAPLI